MMRRGGRRVDEKEEKGVRWKEVNVWERFICGICMHVRFARVFPVKKKDGNVFRNSIRNLVLKPNDTLGRQESHSVGSIVFLELCLPVHSKTQKGRLAAPSGS